MQIAKAATDRRRLWIKRSLLILASFLFPLLIGEFLVAPHIIKEWEGRPRSVALCGFSGTPNTVVDDVAINAEGYTGPLVSEAGNRPDAIRVVTLGGSAMFNRRMGERIGEGLQKLTKRPVDVYGGALRVHSSRSSLIKYRAHFRRLKPDFVIVYHAINDLWMNHYTPPGYRADYSHYSPWNRRNALLNHSMFARSLFNRFMWKGTVADAHNGMNFKAEESFQENLRGIVRETRADGAVPVLMTFAWHLPANYDHHAFLSGQVGYNNPERYDPQPVSVWGTDDYVKEGLRRHNEVIRKISVEEKVSMVDQQKLLGEKIENFGDLCHPSEIGVDRFVANLADLFRREKLLD